MEVPEEEADRFVCANTLNSFKNSSCWSKIQEDRLILYKTHCEFWIWDDISPASGHKIFHKNSGLFNVPRNVSLKSSLFPMRRPHQKGDKDIGKVWDETEMEGWALNIFLQWAKLQKQEKNPPFQFSHPGVPLWDRRRMRQGVKKHQNSWQIICMNVLSYCLLVMVRNGYGMEWLGETL